MGVGSRAIRVDACEKVTGGAKYTDDLRPANCLVAKVVRSAVANGRVKAFDLAAALAVPGVVKIVTCFDVPDYQFPTAGHPWSVEKAHQDIGDRKLLNQRVRLYGDDIAAVVAVDEIACRKAASLIGVEYEEYPPLVTVEQAMAEGATPLHPDLRKDNVIAHSHLTMGPSDFEYEKALEEARETYGEENLVTVEKEYHTPRVSHCHIELPVSWAYQEPNGKITVTSSTQIPHIVRRVISQALGIPVGQVRVIKPYIGGGFGNKQDVLYEPLNAYLSLAVGGRPVRLEISREETIYGTRTRHAIEGRCRALATKDGTVLARKLEAYANNGGYASHGHSIVAKGMGAFPQLYPCDNLECDCWTVYTNRPAAGAMRGYGIPQAMWAGECHIDDICKAIGLEPMEFRRKNLMPVGYTDGFSKNELYSDTFNQCMDKGMALLDYARKYREYQNQTGPIRKGVGLAVFWYNTAVWPISLETSSARMVLNQDGTVQLHLGATEIGQGGDTVFSQMAAQAIGIPTEDVHIVSFQDTDTAPFDTGAYASRQTYVTGKAIKKVGEECAETIIAAKNGVESDTVGEISDLIYHLTVMMVQQGIPLEAVMEELEQRSHKIGNLKQMRVTDHNT